MSFCHFPAIYLLVVCLSPGWHQLTVKDGEILVSSHPQLKEMYIACESEHWSQAVTAAVFPLTAPSGTLNESTHLQSLSVITFYSIFSYSCIEGLRVNMFFLQNYFLSELNK